MTRVSVVMPFYDAKPFIEEAIESVLAQSFGDWQLLLVDDASTDGSTAIAQRYSRDHPERISYLIHPQRTNRGASASRNLGIRSATGEYLAFLDADDVWLPDKLSTQVELLDRMPGATGTYCSTEYWFSWDDAATPTRPDHVWAHFGVPPNTLVDPPRLLVGFLEDGDTVPCTGSLLLRREAVLRLGGYEESFRKVCTDQVFNAKLCLSERVYVADGCHDRYRQHGNSSCAQAARSDALNLAWLAYFEWLAGYLGEKAVVHPPLWAALEKALECHPVSADPGLQSRADQLIDRIRSRKRPVR